MKHIGRSASIWLLALCTIFLFFSCATINQLILKGTVVEVDNSEVYLCIGYKDGAEIGQDYKVYKIIHKVRYNYERRLEGTVRIMEVLDEHFSRAKVISGKAEKHDIVERVKP